MSATAAERAWRAMEGRLRPFVARRVSVEADVDDVMQEVFLKASRGLEDLRDEDRLDAWFFTVARRAIVDHHRGALRQPVCTDRVPEHPEEPFDAEGEWLGEVMTACVAAFVAELPDGYREAVTLVELEGVAAKEAAEMLGLSHSGLKSRVQRGRRLLRARFEAACALSLDGRRKVVACEPRGCG
ncbi:MAG: sigma-70 family RNA polymerase sigma factor [Myxococcales bacterium]|nr:sigma-70 family RNA polymerase sigma factor [Myxococcales bacterium]